MRALGKSPGAGIMGALFAVPSMLGPAMPGYPAQPPYPPASPTQQAAPSPQQAPPAKSPVERLRELKQMLDEGLISAEEYEEAKKEILEQMKKGG